MRAFLLVFCLLSVSTAIGQNRWSFGLDFQAGISGVKAADPQDYFDVNNNLLSRYESGQVRGPAYSGGVWVGFRVWPFLEVRSGVAYRGQQIGWYHWSDDLRPASPRVNDYRSDYQLQSQRLELPTSARLTLFAKRSYVVRPFIELGVRPGWIVSGEYHSVQETGFTPGRFTQVYRLKPKEHSQQFAVPAFGTLGVEVNRFSFSLAYHRQNTFTYGQQNYYLFCGIGEPFFPESSYYDPYVNPPEWKHTITANLSYRLF